MSTPLGVLALPLTGEQLRSIAEWSCARIQGDSSGEAALLWQTAKHNLEWLATIAARDQALAGYRTALEDIYRNLPMGTYESDVAARCLAQDWGAALVQRVADAEADSLESHRKHMAAATEITRLREALDETKTEIEYWHADYLTPEERAHPRGSGWARVYDKINAALAKEPA